VTKPAVEHRLGRADFSLANGGRRLDVHDHRMLEIDKVVVGIGVDRRLVGRGCIAGRRIGRRDRLRLDRRRPAEGRVIENRKIFSDRATGGRIEVFDLADPAPSMRIGNYYVASTAKASPPTTPSFMQRATTVWNSLRRRSLSRKRPWRFLENVE
jgi:hypothetical protein